MIKCLEYDHYPCKNNNIDVDILMITYNHQQYIEQAIKSILMQETQYKYKIIIGEDCSTDNTREIVKSYYNKYPDKIELVLWRKNGGANNNACKLRELCKSKYVATLEGDDYWTDSLKLEKQINFLEHNLEYIGTSHNVRCVDEDGRLLHGQSFNIYPVRESHIFGKKQALNCELSGQTASMVYRNIWKDMKPEIWKVYKECPCNGDNKTNIILGILGDIYCFRDIMADHRRVFEGDSWTAQCRKKDMDWIQYINNIELEQYIFLLTGEKNNVNEKNKQLLKKIKGDLTYKFTLKKIKVLLKILIKEMKI